MQQAKWIIGVTGASGVIYAQQLLQILDNITAVSVELIISNDGKAVIKEELGIEDLTHSFPRVTVHQNDNMFSPLASGSYLTEGMVICPCTMSTMGAVASGLADNLIRRASSVTLKEHRKLILVPRETPLSQIDLLNMLKISRAGGIILPAMPSFYTKPQTIEELAGGLVQRILDQMQIPNNARERWGNKNCKRDF